MTILSLANASSFSLFNKNLHIERDLDREGEREREKERKREKIAFCLPCRKIFQSQNIIAFVLIKLKKFIPDWIALVYI